MSVSYSKNVKVRWCWLLQIYLLCSTLQSIAGTETITPASTLVLTDETSRWELFHEHQQRRDTLDSLTDTLGSGACVLDFDKDGFMDVFFVGGSGQRRSYGAESWWQSKSSTHQLYKNREGFRFDNVTETLLKPTPHWGTACHVGDLDNDGYEDVVVSGLDDVRIYINDAGKAFRVMSVGMISPGWFTGIVLADINRDGLLDIYLMRFIDYQKGQRVLESNTGFQRTTASAFSLDLYDSQSNIVLLNQGKMRFVDATSQFSLSDSAGRGLSTLFFRQKDSENSFFQLANAASSPSMALFLKRDTSIKHVVPSLETTRGLRHTVLVDLDGDGQRDMLGTTPAGEVTAIALAGEQGSSTPVWDYRLTSPRDLAFSGWGVAVIDIDLDGENDIVIGNGKLSPHPDAHDMPMGQPNSLFLKRVEGYEAHTLPEPNISSTRSVLRADFNNDGRSDLLFINNNSRPQLLMNTSTSIWPWLGILVEDSNGAASVAADVVVRVGDDAISLPRYADQAFWGRHDPRYLIRLKRELIDEVTIEVTWPNSLKKTFSRVQLGHYYTIVPEGNEIKKLAEKPAIAVFEENRLYRKYPSLYLFLQTQRLTELDIEDRESLLIALQNNSNALQKVVYNLPDQPAPSDLVLLELALRADDEDSVIAALEKARVWESPLLTESIVALLDHTSPRIVCTAASLFTHYFKEEEIDTHKKYLAVAPLIRLLKNNDDEVKICGLLALAEAERRRGMNAIIELTQSKAESVAVTAVYTLGRIRQSDAAPFIAKLLTKNDTSKVMQVAAKDALFILSSLHNNRRVRPELKTHEQLMLQVGRDTNPSARLDTYSELRERDGIWATDDMISLYQSDSIDDQRALMSMIRAANAEPRVTDLIALLRSLNELDDANKVIRILNLCLVHSIKEVRHAAVKAAGGFTNHPAVERRLWRLLESPNAQEDRQVLGWVLGTKDAQRTLTLLKAFENE